MQITNVAITGNTDVSNVSVTYEDGNIDNFQCEGRIARVIAILATSLKTASGVKSNSVTGDAGSRRFLTRDSGIHGGDGSVSTAPTAMNAEFMRLVRAVVPKYDNALPGTDPRLVALDVLRFAPAEAFSAVHPTPLSEISLDEAVDVLEQVGDYMKANEITPKALSTADAIRSINTENSSFWNGTK